MVAKIAQSHRRVDASAALRVQIEAWETETLDLARARDAFNFHRSDGLSRLGMVLGELRATLGGSQRAAYGYTQSNRTSGPVASEGVSQDEEPDTDL